MRCGAHRTHMQMEFVDQDLKRLEGEIPNAQAIVDQWPGSALSAQAIHPAMSMKQPFHRLGVRYLHLTFK